MQAFTANTALMTSAPIDPIQQHLVTIENMKKLIALKRKGHDIAMAKANKMYLRLLLPCVTISGSLSVCSLVLPAHLVAPVSGCFNAVVTVLAGLQAQMKFEAKVQAHKGAIVSLNKMERLMDEAEENINLYCFGMSTDQTHELLVALLKKFPNTIENIYTELKDLEQLAPIDDTIQEKAEKYMQKVALQDHISNDDLRRNRKGQISTTWHMLSEKSPQNKGSDLSLPK